MAGSRCTQSPSTDGELPERAGAKYDEKVVEISSPEKQHCPAQRYDRAKKVYFESRDPGTP